MHSVHGRLHLGVLFLYKILTKGFQKKILLRNRISFYTHHHLLPRELENVLSLLHEIRRIYCQTSERPPRVHVSPSVSTRKPLTFYGWNNHQYNSVALSLGASFGEEVRMCTYTAYLRQIVLNLLHFSIFLIVKLLSNNNKALHFSLLDLYSIYADGTD